MKVITLKPYKVLAIQFKYLGDAVILTPALKALATQIPEIELHVLVAADIAPLLDNLPWIAKVWAMPRQRGRAKLKSAVPFIRALRREKFAQSVDFGGNDRGALLSYLCGAKHRLGSVSDGDSNFLKRIFYTNTVVHKNPVVSYFDLHFELLGALNVHRPERLSLEICLDDTNAALADEIFPNNSILCHITTSQPKKDWPLSHWIVLSQLAQKAGLKLFFSAGPNEREIKLLSELKIMVPEAEILPPTINLKLFLNILKRSKVFVCGDTGPLHFAEGLGVPVLGILAVGNSLRQVAPIYSESKIICGVGCACDAFANNADVCLSSESCMASIRPETVYFRLINILNHLH